MISSNSIFVLHVGLALAGICVAYAISILRIENALHMLQLDSYSNWRLLRWLGLNPFRRLIEPRTATLLVMLWLLTLTKWRPLLEPASLSVMWLFGSGMIFLLLQRIKPVQKKPLVYTGRAKRVLAVALGLNMAVGYFIACSWYLNRDFESLFFWLFFFLQLCPLIVIVSNVLLIPVQKFINYQFLRNAKKRLADWKPRVIGVAGSFGKTSTKYFIEGILATKFRALKTPGSFNTPMGVCRVINEELTANHEVFIVEMGTYRKGDVREIAKFVRPTIGIIASIGPEHMERFKTMDNVKAANFELIEGLPKDGVAVLNVGHDDCRELFNKAKALKQWKVYGFSLEKTPDSHLWAEDISYSKNGTTFNLVSASGEKVAVKSGLLGRHAVSNIVGASCVAQLMDLTLTEIAQGIPALEPAPHRLQLMNNNNGVTIIDDAYNSNPEGAREALNVLQSFNTGSRVLVTPGMVELGILHEVENEAFGLHAAKTCDFAILVGPKQTVPIARGLEKGGFPKEKTFIVKNLAEATGHLGKILKPGDTVLFENDLPDQYAEN